MRLTDSYLASSRHSINMQLPALHLKQRGRACCRGNQGRQVQTQMPSEIIDKASECVCVGGGMGMGSRYYSLRMKKNERKIAGNAGYKLALPSLNERTVKRK